MFKHIIYFISLFMLLINTSVIAATTTVGPPYPEVWGYDVSTFPAIKWGSATVSAHPMDDGDIWFLVTYSYTTKFSADFSEHTSNSKYILIKFFKGEQTELSDKGRTELFKIIEKQKTEVSTLYDRELIFSDKSKLQFQPHHTSANVFFPDYYNRYFLKTDPQGQEKRYSILAVSPQVEMWRDGGYADVVGAPFYYQKLYLLRDIIPLKDDTFIVFENGSNLILRFNKNFETKFKPVTPVRIQGNYIMRNFFVIDYSLIEDLKKKFSNTELPLYQSIHDGLLSHFHTQYGG